MLVNTEKINLSVIDNTKTGQFSSLYDERSKSVIRFIIRRFNLIKELLHGH